ncbi:unnamed protein product [Brassicogethes aeneus]|nr:unnamed protein product [Brassicogethes aeneus]
MYLRETNEDEDIVREGEFGNQLYISYEGKYSIFKDNQKIVTFNDIRVFGELSLLYNAKRLASIRSISNGKLWVLDCIVFKALIVKTALEEQTEMIEFLQKVPKLNAVSVELLMRVANLFQVEFFQSDFDIVTEGENADKFYVIRAGEVEVSKSAEKLDVVLGKGKFFGELAILKEDVRQATITAKSPGVECLTLSSKQFMDHFGDLEEFINIKLSNEYTPVQEIREFNEIEISDLTLVTTLGAGGYGRVELVRHKKDANQVFALKYIKKEKAVSIAAQDHIKNEKELQMSCNSKFIVRLYRTYKDPKYVYFLLECCLGGDMFNLMRKKFPKGFAETASKFYAACVLEGLAYLHERGIAYRDLKPENIVVSSNGYIKLTDFGFAKLMDSKDKAFTFVGTPEYIAPEIIKNEGHNIEVDYWAYGIFIYELFTSRTPFRSRDPSNLKTYRMILQGIDHVAFPNTIPSKAKQIIKQLCRPKGFERLGCQKNGIKDIKSHHWFGNFHWGALSERKLLPPFKPDLKSNTDTRCFQKFRGDTSVPQDEFSDWDKDF